MIKQANSKLKPAKHPVLQIFILCLSLFLISCTSESAQTPSIPQRSIGTYADYIGINARIAVQAGSVHGDVAREVFQAADTPEYVSLPDMLEALRRGRLDAVMLGHSYVRQLIDSGMYPDFDYLWIPREVYVNEAAPVFHTVELRDQYNQWFRGIAADGTWDEIVNRWIGAPLPAQEDIPQFELTGENGTLRIADTGNYPPLIYFDANGDPAGFDVEMVSRFAQYLGMNVEFTMMAYEGIIPYVLSGRADMSGATLDVTAERGESVLFGYPSVITQLVLIVPVADGRAAANTVQDSAVRDHTYFAGRNIAVLTGAITYETVERIGANTVYYSEASAAAEDVRRGRMDGYITALSSVRVMVASLGRDIFEAIAVPKEIFTGQEAGISYDQEVIDRFNVFLSTIKSDGTLVEMQNRWFGDEMDLDAPMPVIPNSGENGILRVATTADLAPYAYVGANGQLTGFCVELALRFGAYESRTVEFADMAFGAMIPYIVSHRADIGISGMAITEERRQSVLFTDPFFEEQHGILTLRQDSVSTVADERPLHYTDFAGKRIGMRTGSVWDVVIENNVRGTPVFYSDVASGVEDLRRGRIDGFMQDMSALRILVNMSGNEDIEYVVLPEEVFLAPMGAISLHQDIINRFNDFLAGIKTDGLFDEIQNRWLITIPDENSPMPHIPLTGTNGTLRVATSAASLPFAYMGTNNEPVGYSIEIIRRFAAHEGMDLEISEMDFSGLIPFVLSGRADIAIANISITEERSRSVLFTDPIYNDLGAIITLKRQSALPDERVNTGGFIEWLRTGIERNLITDNRWRLIVNGLGVTMTISFLAQIFGTVFGCLVCYVLMRKNKAVNLIGRIYCGLIHGTPIVVLLMITYYIIFGNTNISNVIVAVAAFTLIRGAGVAQNLKGAIDTVDPVEIEAARSIGFSAFRAFTVVTLPQAVRRAMPGYTNGFVELVKATAIVGYIAIQDLTRAGDIIRSRTYDAYFPLLFVAAIYLIVTSICVQLFKFIVKKINREGDQ